MKKKVCIFITAIILILLCVIAFGVTRKTDNDINKKGTELFGNDYCNRKFEGDSEHSDIAGMAFTLYTCEICNKTYEHPNTATPKICSTCATITNRCQYCGKLEN